jgi:cytochrome c553
MRRLCRRAAWLALILPGFVLAASDAQRERADVVNARPDQAHGAELFGQCVVCHGADGGGETNGSTPRIAGQHFRVLAKQLVDFRYGKRWDFRMESMADRHHLASAQDVADVASYVSRLAQPGARGIGSGEFVASGGRIYAAQCQSCHGANAEGSEDGVPRLAGQHYGYLMRQMYDSVDGRRPALSRLHSKRIATLDFEQVRAVADYLARVGWRDTGVETRP